MLNITDSKLLKLIEDEGIAQTMLEVCITLFELDQRQVHIGGLLRLAGISNETAEAYDTEAFLLDEDFYDQIESIIDEAEAESGMTQTLH